MPVKKYLLYSMGGWSKIWVIDSISVFVCVSGESDAGGPTGEEGGGREAEAGAAREGKEGGGGQITTGGKGNIKPTLSQHPPLVQYRNPRTLLTDSDIVYGQLVFSVISNKL